MRTTGVPHPPSPAIAAARHSTERRTRASSIAALAPPDRPAWLGGLFLFDWWGPTTGAVLGATSTGTLWATDGSDAGTLAVADLFLNDSYYCEDHSEWFHAGNAVFVHQPHSGAGMCGAFGEGDLKGTTGLRPVVLLTHDAYGLQPFSGGLLMVADDGRTGDEVHVTDGTVAGTRVLRDIDRGRAGSRPTLLDRYGGRFLFTADDSLHGRELWVTDGTRRGTSLVRDIWPGHHGAAFGAGSFPESFRLPSAHLRHRVYFAANDGVHGNELWVTDGTRRGTHLVKDIRSGPRGSRVIDLKAAGTTLCFRADVGRGWTDWVSDGTAAGTHRGRCPSSET